MVRKLSASPSSAVRLHWRSGRVRSVTLPLQGPAARDGGAAVPAHPPLQALPATQGMVGSAEPAVNDAVRPVFPVPGAAEGGWSRWLRAIAAWPRRTWGLLRSPRSAAIPVARVGQGWHGPRALSHWPAAWPHADAGLGGGSNSFPSSGGDHLHFAPDVFVDQAGRILRL